MTYSFLTGADSAPSENEYQKHFLGVKAAGVWGWQPHHLHVPNVTEIWSLNFLEPSGPHRARYGTPLPFLAFLSLNSNSQIETGHSFLCKLLFMRLKVMVNCYLPRLTIYFRIGSSKHNQNHVLKFQILSGISQQWWVFRTFTNKSGKNVTWMITILHKIRHVALCDLTYHTELSLVSCQIVLTQNLRMRRIAGKVVPRLWSISRSRITRTRAGTAGKAPQKATVPSVHHPFLKLKLALGWEAIRSVH